MLDRTLGGYTSTKCAVDALTLAARAELEKDGIKVCLIRPKLFETDFGRHAFVPEPDALRDRINPNAPPMDTPDFVALKIVELVRTEAAELNLGVGAPCARLQKLTYTYIYCINVST